jgi:probable rRNA maturation factor
MMYAQVIYNDEPWLSDDDSDWLVFFEPIVKAVLLDQEAQGWASILLTHDDHMRSLNKEFRGKDKPTNVLSFPMDKVDIAGADGSCLGDIALAYETIEREASDAGILFKAHAAHMMVHGVLHLLGYQHETDEEANVMEMHECRIMKHLGYASPYPERECL